MGGGKGCVPVHWYCTFCWGLWWRNQEDRSVFSHTNLTGMLASVQAHHVQFMLLWLFSLLRVDLIERLLWVFSLRLSYVCVRCAAQVWSAVRFPAEWSLQHTLSHQGGREKNRKKEGMKWRERVTDAPVHLPENRTSTLHMATLAGILIVPSQTVLSLSPLFWFLSFSSAFPLCPLHIMWRLCALTPTLVRWRRKLLC